MISGDAQARQRIIVCFEDAGATGDVVMALGDEDSVNRQVALDALARLREPTIFDAIAPLLRDDEPDVRAAAARALGATGGPRAVDRLGEILADPDPLVRKWAVLAIWGSTRAENASTYLEPLATQDPEPTVRAEAARALRDLNA